MNSRTLLGATFAIGLIVPTLSGQQPPPLVGAQFDVVSIKPHKDDAGWAGMRYLADGTLMTKAWPLASILPSAAPEPVYEVIGLPHWARSEFYDITGKPAPGVHPTEDQRREMLRHLFMERFNLNAHLEEAERATFALMLARSDRRLGPQLQKSSARCAPPSEVGTPPPEGTVRCGFRFSMSRIEATGMTLDRFVLLLRNSVGAQVANRTDLDGAFDLKLQFAPAGLSANDAVRDDQPQLFTAVQEQLGLKLVPEETKVKVFVIDHIERPTPNN